MTSSGAETKHRLRRDGGHAGIDTRMLDSLPDAAILTDVQGVILYWNASASRLFGWTAAEMIGHPYIERFPEVVRPWMVEEIGKRANGVDWEGEYEDFRSDGSRVWIHACVSRILDELGEPIAILGISRDISARKRTEAKLIESQRRLEEAQRIARLASWSWDAHTQKVWWSDAIYELFGLVPGQVEPSFEAFLEMLHPDDREIAIHRAQAVRRDELTAHDMRLIRPDGRMIWIHSRSRATRDASGQIIRVEGTDQDITERKLAEQALRESEERYRNFVEHTLDGLMIHSTTSVILDVNSQVCNMLGYTREELLGQTPYVYDCDLQAHQYAGILRQLMAGNTVVFESRHRRKDGAILPVEVRLRPIPFQGRNAALALIRDLSHSREAQWHREDRNRLWNHSPDLLLVADRAGIVMQANPTWEWLLDWSESQLQGQRLIELVHAEDVLSVQAYLDQLVSEENECAEVAPLPTALVFRIRSRDGSYRTVSWNAIFVPMDGMVYGFARDVTEQKRLEEQYRQSHKMEAIGQLAGGIAHDFNNLLTVIRSYSDLLLARCAKLDETAEQLMAIREASERAAGLTAQLLAFGRKAIVEPKVLDLNKSVEGAARLLRRLIGEDICIQMDLDSELWKVTIDPVQLEQTLMNLAVNARDAMPRGGLLTIETKNVQLPDARFLETTDCAAGQYVQLTISDDGMGMSDEVKRHLFEPFYTTKGVGKGTGLGLATVYGIVHQSGGMIHCQSELDQGTVFRIYLPAVRAAVAEVDPTSPVTRRGRETVLLVEDEHAVRQLAKLILQMQGYLVIDAASGAEALKAARDHNGPIDLLLSDVVMPDLAGSELADQVRRLRTNVRVLYMSGYTDDAIVRKGVESAVNAFLQKPFTPEVLTQKVREVLES